jgi:hypothetical protein
MPRLKKQPILYQEKINLPEEKDYLRFATPKEVALYRAEKLSLGDKIILDIGAGIGGQTLAFSKKFKKVISIEINKKAKKILEETIKKLNIKNIQLIEGDALSKEIMQKISKEKIDVVFWDTERAEQGKRSINDLKPDIKELLKQYSKITDKIAIEIPPFTQDLEDLKKQGYIFEKEFISLKGQLNRLTLYFNSLKKSDISVVSLPSKEKLETTIEEITKLERIKNTNGFSYLFSISPAVVLAQLEDNLAEKLQDKIINLSEKPYLLSNEIIKSDFLQAYKILKKCKNEYKEILKNLKELKAEKVILKFKISPEEYWKVRNSYEKNFSKDGKAVSLFVNENSNEAILCEKMN